MCITFGVIALFAALEWYIAIKIMKRQYRSWNNSLQKDRKKKKAQRTATDGESSFSEDETKEKRE